MSTAVEQRVAEMRFDNKQFESAVSTSMSTLKKLNSSLNLLGASKGLEGLEKAAKKCDVSPLGDAVDSVKLKFSAMEVMAVTALTNITNSAVNAGKRLISSLSVDQISAGWTKFGQKTSSVGTLISQGYGLDTVTEQLDRLNWFTDETSYNFTDMVDNIAKFTASGKDLTESVTAIEGVANWAALSGQNAAVASRAMYQISQAMGAGVMRKEDYKSIQNASMDTDEFRQKALDAAVALGTLQKNADGTYQSLVASTDAFTKSQFADHLTEDAWFTSDVMMKVFNEYSAAVDEIYEYAEEKGITASEAIEQLGSKLDPFALKAFKAAQEARTFGDAIDSVKDAVSTGWMNTFELIFGNYEEAKTLWTDLANSMYDVFAEGGNRRNEILEAWKDAGGRDALIESFWNLWEAITQPIEAIKQAYREIFSGDTEEERAKFGERLAETTEKLKSFTASFLEFGEKGERISLVAPKIAKAFKGLFAVVDLVGKALIAIGKFASPVLSKIWSFSGDILDTAANIGDWLVSLRDASIEGDVFNKAIEKVSNAVKKLYDGFKKTLYLPGLEVINSILAVTEKRISQFKETFKSFGSTAMETLKGLWKSLLSSDIFNKLKGVFTNFGSGLKSILTGLGEGLSGLITRIGSADFSGFFDIINSLISGGIGVAIIGFIKNISSAVSSTEGLFSDIKGILSGVLGCLEAYQDQLKADTLMKIAKAIGILAVSLVVLSFIDSAKLTAALASISILFGELLGGLAIIGKVKGLNSISGLSKPLVKIAAAILILSIALKTVSGIESGKLIGSLAGMFALITMIVSTLKKLNRLKGKAIKGAGSIIIFASAIAILASVCKSLSVITWSEMAIGLAGIGALLAAVVTFLHALPKDLKGGKVLATALGMVLLASALAILSAVCKSLSGMTWAEIGKGLSGIGGLLLELAAFTRLIGNGWTMLAAGASIIGISIAMKILVSALSDMSGMSWGEIGKGLLVMGASLVILAVGMNAMNGAIGGAFAMLIAAASLAILTPVLATIGSMSWTSIVKGLVAIAGAFTIIGVAGLLLGPITPLILGLAASIALIGIAVLAAGAGIVLLSTGLTALSASLAILASAIVSAIETLLLGIIELLPPVVKGLVDGIVIICDAIANGLDQLLAIVLEFLSSALSTLATYIPQIITGIFDIIVGAVNSVAEKVPELITAIISVIYSVFEGVAAAFGSMDMSILTDGLLGIGLLTGLMVALGAAAPFVPEAMAGVLGLGGIIAELAIVLAAVGALGQIPGLTWLISEGGELLETLGTAIGQFFGGIVGGIVLGATSNLSEIASNFSDFMTNLQPFLEGAKAIDPSIGDSVAALSLAMLSLTGADLVNSLASWITGGSSLAAFGSELATFGPGLKAFSDSIIGIDPVKVTAAADAAKVLAEFADLIPTTGGLKGLFTGKTDINAFSEDLKAFGEALSVYSDSISGIDETKVSASAEVMSSLVETFKGIGYSSFTNISEKMTQFSEGLKSFGPAFKEYADATATVNGDNIVATAESIESLSKSFKTISGIKIDDEHLNLNNFGEQLADFGKTFSKYGNRVSGLDTEKITATGEAAKALGTFAKTVSEIETGDSIKNLDSFGDELIVFGSDLSKFCEYTSDIDSTRLTASAEAAKLLGEFGKIVSEVKFDIDDGGVNLRSFGSQLESFGIYLYSYWSAIKDVSDFNKLTESANAAQALATFVETVSGITFEDKGALEEFGTQLNSFARKFVGGENFYELVKELNPDIISQIALAVQELANVVTAIDKIDFANGGGDLDTFGQKLAAFGPNLMSFAEATSDMKTDAAAKAADVASTLGGLADSLDDLSGIDTEKITGLIATVTGNDGSLMAMMQTLSGTDTSGVSSFTEALQSLATDGIEAFINAFSGSSETASNIGGELSLGIVDGAQAEQEAVETGFAQIVDAVAAAVRGSYEAFESAGGYLVQGLVAGINASAYLAQEAGAALGLSASGGLESAVEISSPSKVTKQDGVYFATGFVDMLWAWCEKSRMAGAGVGQAAMNGLNKSIATISGVIDGSLDTQPTIRPVLDLSEIQNGANSLYRMMDDAGVYALSGSMDIARQTQKSVNGRGLREDYPSSVIDDLKQIVKGLIDESMGGIHNTFYITSDDPNKVADAVSRTIQKQTERKNARWG